jgi:hypothetical protein
MGSDLVDPSASGRWDSRRFARSFNIRSACCRTRRGPLSGNTLQVGTAISRAMNHAARLLRVAK